MIRFFITLLVSWSISSWLLSELYYFVPDAAPVVASLEEAITIPRHDKWDTRSFFRELDRIEGLIDEVDVARDVSLTPYLFQEQPEAQAVLVPTSSLVWDDFGGTF